MAEDPGGEKTLPASPAKRQKAREEGNVAKSQDLNAAITLLIAMMALYYLAPRMLMILTTSGEFYFGGAGDLAVERDTMQYLLATALLRIAQCVVPFRLVMMVAGLTTNMAQVGLLISSKALTPKPERLNPVTGFKKFVSVRSLVELVKSIAKLSIVGTVVWLTLRGQLNDLIHLMDLTPWLVVLRVASIVKVSFA